MIPALEALERLREGNRRFAADASIHSARTGADRRDELTRGQEPFAVILGCSDSRAPAELLFDQGLGDLFVIRVAGNIVASSQVASIEFAVESFGTRLVVVLGHSYCGAVRTTIEELGLPLEQQHPNLRSIVDRIRPAVATLLETDLRDQPDELMRLAVRANIRAAAGYLRNGSEILKQLVRKDSLLIVGAEYSLETGEVEFFDGLPETS